MNIWDNFKLELDSIRAIEGVEKTERKKTQKEKYQKRQIILPAGMDVGRFIEDSLKMYVYYYFFFQLYVCTFLNNAKFLFTFSECLNLLWDPNK